MHLALQAPAGTVRVGQEHLTLDNHPPRLRNALRRVYPRLDALTPVTEADAVHAARLWTRTRAAGLSLGDRCCLALGARLGLTTVTADTAWDDLDVDVDIRLIR